MNDVERKIQVVEKERKRKYAFVNDPEVIYHFVHLQKDMDEKKK